jgi:hypothetical protein
MKKLSFSRASKIVGVLSLGTLLFLGFTGLRGQYSISQLQREPLLLDVPVFQQSRGTSCGEAVIAMTYNYAYPDAPVSEQEVIEYATANGYFTEQLYPYTSPANMVKIARYYADDISSGNVLSSRQGLAVLADYLRRGDPVIIDVLSDFGDPESEAHFIVITGISVDLGRQNAVVVHYNDPLTGTKESADWLGSQGVWNAWRTNGDPGGSGWWLVIAGERRP